MSVYSVKGKGWRYDFTLKRIRYSEAGFKTKTEAKQAEAKRREDINNPVSKLRTPTDMDFLELVNRRLDYINAYHSERHYTDHIYLAKRWIKQWGKLKCNDISPLMLQGYLIKRSKATSGYTANKELRSLRALFNFALNPIRGWIKNNPTYGIEFFPVEKRIKYVPPKEDVLRVLLAADPDTQDYLWTIALTMGRMSEINRLTWQDIDLKDRFVICYMPERKKAVI